MREAFLIHVGSACEAIEKKGYFKSFKDHSEDYSEKREKVKELKKQLEALMEAIAAQPQEKAPKRPRLMLKTIAQPPCKPKQRQSSSKP